MKTTIIPVFAVFILAGSVTRGSEFPPTFSRDIAPIVYRHCTECHRPNQAAPFSLITYEQVARRARLCARLIERGYMPPWKPVPGHGDFVGERRQTDEEIELFQTWVTTGRTEGDPADLPPLPTFPDRWRFGEPDLIVKMDSAYDLPAEGPDIYRNFVVETGLNKDVWIKAVELRPQSPKVVHHVLMFGDDTGLARDLDKRDAEEGFPEMLLQPNQVLGAYVPGADPLKLPEGLSIRLPKNTPLVLQTHFHLSGKPETEQLEVGIYLADKPSEKTIVNLQLPEIFGIGAGIDIPKGEPNYQINHKLTLPVAVQALGVGGHAHYIGKEMKLTATLPDGTIKSLFYIDDWDLDWQGSYTYRTPQELPKGTILEASIRYDNSAANTNNPFYPPRRIKWGKESTDEMGSITLMVVPARERDAKTLKKLSATERKRAIVTLFRGGDPPKKGDLLRIPTSEKLVKTFDADRSGGINIDEFPVSPVAKRFDRIDQNGDSELDKNELDSMVRFMNLALHFGMNEQVKSSALFRWALKKHLGSN